jgi:ABC-type sugar transport system permease subunit
VYKITQNQSPRLLSQGAAMSIGLFVVTVIITALQFGLLSKRVNYDR